MTKGLNPLFAQTSSLCESTYTVFITHDLQCHAPTLPDSGSCGCPLCTPCRKYQQSSCLWISFKSCLGKLIFYTLQLGVLVYTISISQWILRELPDKG